MHWLVAVLAMLAAVPAIAKVSGDEIMFADPPVWAHVSDPLPVPDMARGAVFLRRQDAQMHLHRSGQTVFTASLIRLLQPDALQVGNVGISWNPAAGKPVVHAIKVHRDGTVRDVLSTVHFEILQREGQLEAAMLDGILTAVLRVPDLRVGDELELSYSVPAEDPTLGPDSAGLLFIASNPVPGRFALRLSWDEGQEPVWRPTPDLASSLHREARAVSVVLDMPGAINFPKDAPQRYAWQRIIEFSDFRNWQSVSSRMAPLFQEAAELSANSAVKQEAARIAAAHADTMERAAAALQLVQQQVRYIYVGFSGGNMTPASAEETWQRRYGDCKGKTALLLAILGELGIPAEAVLASNAGIDDGLDQRLPSPGSFDHVLVRARIDGQGYWLDGTLPHAFSPARTPTMPYRWVLPLRAAGVSIERIEWKPDSRPDELVLYEIDARAGFSEPAGIRQTSIRRGVAAIQEYYQFSVLTDDQMLSAFRQELEGSSSWDVIEQVSWRLDAKEQASIIEISGRGPIEWDDEGKGSRSLSLPGGGFSPPERRQRGSDQDQAAPFYNQPGFDCRITTVRLPTATVPQDWSFNTSYDTVMFGESYRRSFERRDGAIRMLRSTRTLQTEVDPPSAMKDNERIAGFDNSMAWIYFNPGSTDEARRGETVPATYEIDWLTDTRACVAQEAR